MKRKLLIGLAIIFLFLDLTALIDITGGREPSSALGGEYLTIIISMPILLAISYFLFRNKNHQNKTRK